MPKPAQQEFLLPQETTKIPESVRLFIVNIIFWILENIAKIEIDEQSLHNLEQLDQQLNDSSVVVYGYHSSLFDSLVLPILLSQQLNNVDTMIAPVAITHYQGLKKVFLDVMAALTHAKFLPVIRAKDEPNYEHKVKRLLLKQLIDVTRESLSEPNNIYGVAPMSTRDKILKSEAVNPGFIKVAQKHKTPLMPIAFTKDSRGKLQFSAGEILPPPDKTSDLDSAVHMHMSILAQLVPQELRGDYK
jgi:hypothetical protein